MPQGLPPVPLTPSDPVSPFSTIYEIAISPDRSLGVVTDDSLVHLFDLTTNPVSQINVLGFGSDPEPYGYGVAISPDGSKAFVVLYGELVVINLPDFTVERKILASDLGVDGLRYVAVSPTTPEIYLSGDNDFLFINTETYELEATIPFPGGIYSTSNPISISPDGLYAYVCLLSPYSTSYLARINLPLRLVNEIPGVLAYPQGIAITPDGKTAVCTTSSYNPNLYSLCTIDTQTLGITSWPLIHEGYEVAITPDGKTAAIGSSPGVSFIDLSTGSETYFNTGYSGHIAITPDQAPTARFTTTINGNTVAFDASTSTSPTGTVVLYSWDFGDGQTVSTDSTSATHTYTDPGEYPVSLTVTNSAGTSRTVICTGQAITNNGGPSAQMVQTVYIEATAIDPPSRFKAKGKCRHRKNKPLLKTRWIASPSSRVTEYQIFAHNKKIKTILANNELISQIQLHPHHVIHHFSKKYRKYIHHKYAIRAADGMGHTSTFVPLVVKR